jgi:TolA-binding protein
MKRLLVALALAALLLAACASAAATPASDYATQPSFGTGQRDLGGVVVPGSPEEPSIAPMPAPTAGPALEYDKGVGGGNAAQPPAQDRLVIQNASLSMVVKDPRAKMDAIAAMAKAMGGYLVSSSLYDTYSPAGEKLPQATIVIRVPAEKLEDALKQIKADGIEPPTETRTGQDVTQQYVDLESRLRNLESAEKQLTEIMDSATKTEDVLNVFNQLTQVQEQIEVVKGQMQYYEQSAAFSEISTQLIAQESLEPIKIGGWTPQGALSDALQRLVDFWHGLVDFVITFAVYWLPVLIVIAIPFAIVYFVIRAIVRNRSRKNPPAAPLG